MIRKRVLRVTPEKIKEQFEKPTYPDFDSEYEYDCEDWECEEEYDD